MSDTEVTGFFEVFGAIWRAYNNKTIRKVKVIDAYLLFVLVSGIIQFGYMLLVGSFPFNSFWPRFCLASVCLFSLLGFECKLILCREMTRGIRGKW